MSSDPMPRRAKGGSGRGSRPHGRSAAEDAERGSSDHVSHQVGHPARCVDIPLHVVGEPPFDRDVAKGWTEHSGHQKTAASAPLGRAAAQVTTASNIRVVFALRKKIERKVREEEQA